MYRDILSSNLYKKTRLDRLSNIRNIALDIETCLCMKTEERYIEWR